MKRPTKGRWFKRGAAFVTGCVVAVYLAPLGFPWPIMAFGLVALIYLMGSPWRRGQRVPKHRQDPFRESLRTAEAALEQIS